MIYHIYASCIWGWNWVYLWNLDRSIKKIINLWWTWLPLLFLVKNKAGAVIYHMPPVFGLQNLYILLNYILCIKRIYLMLVYNNANKMQWMYCIICKIPIIITWLIFSYAHFFGNLTIWIARTQIGLQNCSNDGPKPSPF